MNRLFVVVAATLLLTGCTASVPPAVTIAGTVQLDWSPVNSIFWFNPAGTACHGEGSESAVIQGAQVIVKNAAGKTVQIGKLGKSRYDPELIACVYAFKFTAPAGSNFYTVTVDGQDAQVAKVDAGRVKIEIGKL